VVPVTSGAFRTNGTYVSRGGHTDPRRKRKRSQHSDATTLAPGIRCGTHNAVLRWVPQSVGNGAGEMYLQQPVLRAAFIALVVHAQTHKEKY